MDNYLLAVGLLTNYLLPPVGPDRLSNRCYARDRAANISRRRSYWWLCRSRPQNHQAYVALSKSPSQIISVGVPNVRSFIRVGFAQLINEYFTSACLASISLCHAFVY